MESKSKSTAFLLCYFLGFLGVHRFYLNKVVSGLLMLITGGGLGIWVLIDSFLLLTDRLRDKAGNPLRIGPPDPDNPNAGFWVRVAAFSADALLLSLVIMVIGVLVAIVLPVLADSPDGQALVTLVGAVLGLIVLLGVWLYFSVPLSTDRQATWGKRAFGLVVTRADGDRVSLGRAIWRTLCYVISSLPLYLGFVMAGLGSEKRALHDRLAGTRVVYADADALPVVSPAAPMAVHREPAPPPAPSAPEPTAAPSAEVVERGGGSSGLGLVVLGLLLLGGAAFLALA